MKKLELIITKKQLQEFKNKVTKEVAVDILRRLLYLDVKDGNIKARDVGDLIDKFNKKYCLNKVCENIANDYNNKRIKKINDFKDIRSYKK